ncbi:MAG: GGDEF domain-containing protein [Thiomargarita sp.]|nr:GGDEF domain-containing protein [Thiomargarita sp.]
MRILLIEENAQDYVKIYRLIDDQTTKLHIQWAPNYEAALQQIKQDFYNVYLISYNSDDRQQAQFITDLSEYRLVPIVLVIKNSEDISSILTNRTYIEILPIEKLNFFILERTIQYLSKTINLNKQEKTFQNIFNNSIGFMVLISTTGILQEANPIALNIMGTKHEAIAEQIFWEIPALAYSPKNQNQIKAAFISAVQNNIAYCEIEIQQNNGEISSVHVQLTPISNKKAEVINILIEGQNSYECQDLKQQLTSTSIYSRLTGLPNRYLFTDMVDKAIQCAKKQKNYRIAVLYLDLDRIKTINAGLGHDMGDWLLMAVAERLQDCIKVDNNVLAHSGNEFMILLENMENLAVATYLAATITKILTKPIIIGDYEIIILASIGIAYYTSQKEATDLLCDANIAMNNAKAHCKNCHIVFSRRMREQAIFHFQKETSINQSIKRNDFLLFYQPQIDLYSQEIVAIEISIRFQYSQNYFLLPDDFLPALEDTDAIIKLEAKILNNACQQLRKCIDAKLPIKRISVNLSIHQFRNQQLIEIVRQAIENAKLSPQNLELELTRNLSLQDTNLVTKTFNTFKEMGVLMTIDNFGSEHSFLDYLRRFPINGIKIDHSFIENITSSPEDAAITVSTIDMAHALGLTVTAKGVKTAEQRDFLRDHGCDFVQGYLYADPMEESVFFDWSKEYCQRIANMG